jgi:ATP-dependent Clp protease, protease subunit
MRKKTFKDFRNFYKDKNPYKMTSFDDRVSKTRNTISPYIVKEAELNMSQQDIFSHLLENRIIFFGDEFCPETCNIAIGEILFLNQQDDGKDIEFYINSPGGNITDLFGLLGTMGAVKNDISTTAIGMAASCANLLLTAGTRGKRRALPLAKLLCHQPMGGTSGQQTDIEIEAKFITELKEDICKIYMDSTGLDHDEIWKRMDRDNWVRPEKALPVSKGGDWGKYGMIDEIITKI